MNSRVVFQSLAHQFNRGQLLTQPVVQILADATLLALANFKNLFLECDKALIFVQLLQRAPDDLRNVFQKIRVFNQIVQGAPFHHVHSHPLVSLSSDNKEWNGAPYLGQVINQLLGFSVGQLQVQQHQVGAVPRKPGNGFTARSGGSYSEPSTLERLLDKSQQAPVII